MTILDGGKLDWQGLNALLVEAAAWVPRFLLGILLAGIFLALGSLAQRIVARAFARRDLNRDVEELVEQGVKLSLWVLGVITGLGTMGVNVGGLIAGLGLVGFAVGFALKDAISNLLAGILLLAYHPFQRGDVVSVTGKQGRVVDIDLRYTELETDLQRILVPNSALFSNVVTVEKDPQRSAQPPQ